MSVRTYCLALSLLFCGGGVVFIYGGLTFQGWFIVLIGVLWIAVGMSFVRAWCAIEGRLRGR